MTAEDLPGSATVDGIVADTVDTEDTGASQVLDQVMSK